MTKEDLKLILDAENNKADEMATEWSLISYAAAQRAMTIAYNKAIEDTIKLWRNPSLEAQSIEADADFSKELEQLKIKD